MDGNVIVKDVTIGFVDIDALVDNGLIVMVQRQAGAIIGAGAFQVPGFDFEHVIAPVAVFIEPFSDSEQKCMKTLMVLR